MTHQLQNVKRPNGESKRRPTSKRAFSQAKMEIDFQGIIHCFTSRSLEQEEIARLLNHVRDISRFCYTIMQQHIFLSL